MTTRTRRIEQADVADAIARALAGEQERIRELGPEALDYVVGGAGDTPPGQGGPTLGMIDPTSGGGVPTN